MTGRTNKFLQGLNPPQRDAVRQTEGPVLVLAGAGSGKTRVITQRIAYILSTGKAEAEEILAVTFTNKAAAEMRERVGELVGKAKAKKIVVSTFHSFCLNALRTHIEHLGYRKNFSIAGEGDARTLVRRVIDDISDGDTSFSPGMFQSAISLYKNADRAPDPKRPDPVKNETEEKYQEHMADVYDRYQSALRAANSVDFDDLLLLTLRLWREHPKILAQFRHQFRYVMVDEYQDTNSVQYALLQILVEEHQNFCVVGDDDQSIYGWRGADVKNILSFEKDFPKAKIITLAQNYRSTETILAAANSVIANNTARREKELWSDLGKGRAIDWFVTADEEGEAHEAVRWLKHIQAKSGARWRDFVLLYRSNLQSKPLEIAFQRAGIPYVVVGGQEFFERTEVKDIIAYLKILANPRDEPAFLRIVNMPRRGIGDTTLHKAHELCLKEKLSLPRAMNELIKRSMVNAKVEGGIRDFLGLLSHFRRKLKEKPDSIQELAVALVNAINYRSELDNSSRNREIAEARWKNVELVLDAIGSYEKETKDPSLTGFLDASHLNSDQDRGSKKERREKAVTMMTIHSSKGLEFPFVFIMGVEEGSLPHARSIVENTLEEERRLFYVAITRGRRHVSFFEALCRNKHGRECMTQPSRFLEEIPKELYNQHIHAVRDMVQERVAPPKPKAKKRRPKKKSSLE